MKKIISIVLALVIALTIFSGCNVQGDSSKVVVWHDKEEQVIKVLEEALSGLDFEVEFIRKDGMTDALKLMGNDPKSAPDMYLFAHDKVGLFAEIGILAPITEFVPVDELKENFLEITTDAGNYKGEFYQLPLYFETLLFMYNKDLMVGDVPNTTEKLLAYMDKTTNKQQKTYGFVEQHSTAYYSAPWIQGFGGQIISADGVPTINSKEVVDALEYHRKFVSYMPGESEYSTVNTLFLEKMAHSIIGGPWLVPTAKDMGINLGFAQMPIIDSIGKPLSPYLGVQGVHVLKHVLSNEGKKEKVAQVIDLLKDKSVSVALAKASGCAPSQVKAYEDEGIINDEMVQMMRQTAEVAKPMPNIPEMDVMFNVLGKLLEDVNLKKKDVSESCLTWQEKAEKLILAMK